MEEMKRKRKGMKENKGRESFHLLRDKVKKKFKKPDHLWCCK